MIYKEINDFYFAFGKHCIAQNFNCNDNDEVIKLYDLAFKRMIMIKKRYLLFVQKSFER